MFRRLKSAHRAILLTAMGVICTSALIGQDKQSWAVMDLEARGLSSMEAATLTDRMRSELVKTGAVNVVERGQMQTILAEQDFQMTGCTSDECAVEVGQLLGVTSMVGGSLGKLGTTYTIDIRVIDIATGAISNTITKDYRGEIDGLLKTIEYLSWELVGLVHPDQLLEQLAAEPAPVPPPVAAVAPQPPRPQPRPEPRVAERKRGGGGLLLLALLAGGTYYAYTEGYLDDLLGLTKDEGPEPIGEPPVFPSP